MNACVNGTKFSRMAVQFTGANTDKKALGSSDTTVRGLMQVIIQKWKFDIDVIGIASHGTHSPQCRIPTSMLKCTPNDFPK